jgi:hypothetical protein
MFDKKIHDASVVQIKKKLYKWKVFKTQIFKMILHFLFEAMI